ncbi:uncharacterized protein [Spinacia oleracea]|uniref:Zinc finger GRF-type domain-containing protein n=1 Tax=Spinacia oleracea TaxID=3562 RepID=A0ABM3RRL1_SPIOL|nr:uncharacterized protein LOC130471927 [Spinacia oleracea]
MSSHSKTESSSIPNLACIRVPNKICSCGRRFSIRSSETRKNPQKLYYKCDPCDNFKWCKGFLDQTLEEVQSKGNKADENRGMHEELKLLKKKINQQKQQINFAIKIGVLMFAFLILDINEVEL